MLTMPAAFSAAHQSTSALLTTIVELTDGSNTWLIGDRAMQLTDGIVYPLLKKTSGISESVDIFTRKWAIPNCTVTMSNAPFQTATSSTGYRRRLSDLLYDIRNQEMKVYLGAGSNITSLSDCMQKFLGLVVENPQYNLNEWSVWAVDHLTMNDLILPQNTVDGSGNWGDAPLDNKFNKIPIVYGAFAAFDPQDKTTHNGLAWTEKVVASPTKVVVSDHQLKSIAQSYIHVDGMVPNPPEIDATETANDSGYGTCETFGFAYARLSPTGTDADDYSFGTWNAYITDWQNSVDSDTSTSAVVYNGDDTSAMYYCSFPDWSDGERIGNDIGRMMGHPAMAGGDDGYLRFTFWINTANATVTVLGYSVKAFYETDGSTDSYVEISDGGIATTSAWCTKELDLSEASINWEDNVVWHPGSGKSDQTNTAYGIVFAIFVDVWGGLTVGERHCIQVHNAYLDAKFQPYNKSNAQYYAACEGRTYGTWIDDHSGSGYSSGDLIEDGAGIIESIIVDELGVATARIDMDSFDDAENSSVTMRVNLYEDNQEQASKVIRKVAEQSTFAFCPTTSGKMRLIDLSSYHASVKTLHWSWIIPDTFKIKRTSKIINDLTVESRWRNEANAFADKTIFSDGSSQSNYGKRTINAKWPYLSGSSVTTVGDLYVNNRALFAFLGLWSNEFHIAELETFGYSCAELEVGDWIKLDGTSCDPYLKLYNSSWSIFEWLVVGVTQTQTSTKLKLFLWG